MPLNLPNFDIKLRGTEINPQVFDRLRGKWVALTPEEWVRQHFVNFLIEYRHFPEVRMANEVSLLHNGCRRRCDTIVYDDFAQPIAIVEYKAPDISITERVFDQIARYNMVLHVHLLIVSNGMKHYCCRIEDENYYFLKDVPSYDNLLNS